MFIAGAVVLGGIVVTYDDHSNHSNHSNYSKYGDANMVSAINNKQQEVDKKSEEIDILRQHMEYNFQNRIAELKRKKNYQGLEYNPEYIVFKVKNDMVKELENEIQNEKKQLSEIDRVIARINEIELQS